MKKYFITLFQVVLGIILFLNLCGIFNGGLNPVEPGIGPYFIIFFWYGISLVALIIDIKIGIKRYRDANKNN